MKILDWEDNKRRIRSRTKQRDLFAFIAKARGVFIIFVESYKSGEELRRNNAVLNGEKLWFFV